MHHENHKFSKDSRLLSKVIALNGHGQADPRCSPIMACFELPHGWLEMFGAISSNSATLHHYDWVDHMYGAPKLKF